MNQNITFRWRTVRSCDWIGNLAGNFDTIAESRSRKATKGVEESGGRRRLRKRERDAGAEEERKAAEGEVAGAADGDLTVTEVKKDSGVVGRVPRLPLVSQESVAELSLPKILVLYCLDVYKSWFYRF